MRVPCSAASTFSVVRRELGHERQRLEARDQAVAPEQRHEPRQPGRRQRSRGASSGTKAQRRQVDEAALVACWTSGRPVAARTRGASAERRVRRAARCSRAAIWHRCAARATSSELLTTRTSIARRPLAVGLEPDT